MDNTQEQQDRLLNDAATQSSATQPTEGEEPLTTRSDALTAWLENAKLIMTITDNQTYDEARINGTKIEETLKKQWLANKDLPRGLKGKYKWSAPFTLENLTKTIIADMIATGLVAARPPLSEDDIGKRKDFIARATNMTTGNIMLLLYAYELSARKNKGIASEELLTISEEDLKQEITKTWQAFFPNRDFTGYLALLNDGIWLLPESVELIGVLSGAYRKSPGAFPSPEERIRTGRDVQLLSQMMYLFAPPPPREGGWSH